MSSQLRRRLPSNLLRTEYPWPGLLGSPGPHVRYANLEFGKENTLKKARSLLKSVDLNGWSDERTVHCLEKHQEDFRRCLEWLSKGSVTNFEEPEDESDDFWHVRMREKWEQQPEVKFLQQHGLDHTRVRLQPVGQDGSFFSGIALEQRKPRDPLDLLCWHLLALLMWNGTVGVCRCANKKCPKFFQPRTSRKIFCSNLCRAKAHMDRKSPEAKRQYMRKYRKIRKARELAKS